MKIILNMIFFPFTNKNKSLVHMLFVGLDLLPFSVDYKNQQPCAAYKHIIYLTIVPEQKWAFKRIPYR